MTAAPQHEPVMLREAVAALSPRPGGRYVDATVGLGGHAAAILEASGAGARLLGIDRDPHALEVAAERLAPHADAVVLARGAFADIAAICEEHGSVPVDGILFDLGVSSLQLDTAGRGFSFRVDEPLDMRMDPDGDVTAADIVNAFDEARLATLIWEYGEERHSRRIARSIVQRRPLRSTADLARAVEAATGPARGDRIHPATRTFQALRIAVNEEIEQIEHALVEAETLLSGPGARIVVISFHSLEDRAVKTFFRDRARDCICPPRQPVCTCDHRATLREISRRVQRPTDAEVARNPRARSARLRAAESIAERRAA
ncbi:MAG: 16S rRNA (cytosine(1402)-N(4))-methyltransferase RsmH [Dehalococcoidia bacterium]